MNKTTTEPKKRAQPEISNLSRKFFRLCGKWAQDACQPQVQPQILGRKRHEMCFRAATAYLGFPFCFWTTVW